MTRGQERLIVVGLAVVAAAIRLHGLAAQSLWLDEWYSVTDAARSVSDIVWLPDGEPPLHKLLLHAMYAAGFASDAAVRLPSAVADVLAVPLAWLVARRLADPVVGVVTAALLTLNPFAVWYAHEARVYALMVVCALGATAAWLRGPERSRDRVIYAAWMTVGVGCHYFFVFVALAHAVATIVDVRRTPARRGAWLATFAVATLGMAIWLVPLTTDFAEQTTMDAGQEFSWWAVPYTAFTFVGGFSLGPPLRVLHEAVAHDVPAATAIAPYAGVVGVALFASVGLGVLALSASPVRREPLLATMTIAPAVAPLLVGMAVTGYRPRYAIVALPFWLCWQATALRGRWPRVAAGLLLVIAALQIAGLYQLDDPAYVREDTRAAAAYLREHVTRGPVLLIGEPATAFRRYADPTWTVFDLGVRGNGEPLRTLTGARRALEKNDELAIVSSRPWTIDPQGALRGWFARDAKPLDGASFPGVTVERFAIVHPDPTRGLPGS